MKKNRENKFYQPIEELTTGDLIYIAYCPVEKWSPEEIRQAKEELAKRLTQEEIDRITANIKENVREFSKDFRAIKARNAARYYSGKERKKILISGFWSLFLPVTAGEKSISELRTEGHLAKAKEKKALLIASSTAWILTIYLLFVIIYALH